MDLAYEQTSAPEPVRPLTESFSIEMTGKDVGALSHAADSGVIPAGTPINVTYLATEPIELRLDAVDRVRALGFTPVPHISARRLRSVNELREYLAALSAIGGTERVFVVGGDPRAPEGPYEDALSVICSGILEEFGVRSVGIAGYPEGHPEIADAALWRALEDKHEVLAERGLEATIVTQFCFDAGPVLDWIAAVRDRSIAVPIRVGVPGPAGIKRLLGYARRFGVGTGSEVVRKYGLSLTNLLGSAGPDRFLRALSVGYDENRHGKVQLHFYAFGGLTETAEWVAAFRINEETNNG